ncbi:MAG: hypothetical protein ABI904_12375 [Chloroflexota bacterium]
MFEFNAEDLTANKRGQLGSRQKEWLRVVARGTRSFSWKGAVIIVVFMCLGLSLILALFLQNQDSRAALFSNPVNLIMFPVIGLVILGVIVLSIGLAYWNAKRLENATLLSVAGSIRFGEDSSGESGITSYYVFVGKKRFTYSSDMSRTFKEGGKYKFYYCKPGMYEFVMSYEKIDN